MSETNLNTLSIIDVLPKDATCPFITKAAFKKDFINRFAKFFYDLKSKWINCDKDKNFYMYKHPQWIKITDEEFTRKYLEKIILNIICFPPDLTDRHLIIFITMLFRVRDESEIDLIQGFYYKIKKSKSVVNTILSNPKNYKTFIDKIKEVFYLNHSSFIDKLNKSLNITGFLDGVYDLKIMKFRKGRPTDYISNILPINYNKLYMDIMFKNSKDYFIQNNSIQNNKEEINNET
jgi:hypothetical protein